MKGDQGRRQPLKNLLGRFGIDAIKQRQQQERDMARAIELLRLKAEAQRSHRPRPEVNYHPKRGVTKRPLEAVKAERRAKRKGRVRPNAAKRVRYLRRQKARIGA